MTQKEHELYMKGAKDFAKLVEKDLLKRSYEMPDNPNLTYVYTSAVPLAIANSLQTLDVKSGLQQVDE